MPTKPWYLSKTIWTSCVGAFSAILGIMGHNIDAGTQEVLVTNLTNIVTAISVVAPILAAIFRAKSTTKIEGAK